MQSGRTRFDLGFLRDSMSLWLTCFQENTFTCFGFDVILATMAKQNSFDIVSQVDRAEITNALNQTMKEVGQRFDFKGSSARVVLEEKELVLTAEDETKLGDR